MSWRAVGAILFFVLAPGTLAGLIPWWITAWRVQQSFPGSWIPRLAAAALIVAGLASIVESFVRFVTVGLGTPAPVAPPTRLVVSGQYRYVRNPMYVAVLAIITGQALLLGSRVLLLYAAALWAAFHLFVTLDEEPKLRAQFGDSYLEYRRNVRRWWPRARKEG